MASSDVTFPCVLFFYYFKDGIRIFSIVDTLHSMNGNCSMRGIVGMELDELGNFFQ